MIPEDLKTYDHWVCWKYIERDGRKTKIPITPRNGKRARTNDPSTWGTFQDALDMSRYYNGIGFVFSEDDPFVGLDFDHCITKDGTIEKHVAEFIRRAGTYTETSPSGTGIHMIGRGKLTDGGSGKRTSLLEMYDRLRFFTVTGNVVEGRTTVADVQPLVDSLLKTFFKEKKAHKVYKGEVKVKKEPITMSDMEFLENVLFKQKNGELLRALYEGENPITHGNFIHRDADGTIHPDISTHDFYFVSQCNFANGNDLAMTDRIFRSSGRMRPKWDERRYANGDTYGEGILRRAYADNPKKKATT